jgi:hypothetical protein
MPGRTSVIGRRLSWTALTKNAALRPVRWIQSFDDAAQHRKRVPCAIGFGLLEICSVLTHGVGDMCEYIKGVRRPSVQNRTNRSAKIIGIPNNEAFVIDSDGFQEWASRQ